MQKHSNDLFHIVVAVSNGLDTVTKYNIGELCAIRSILKIKCRGEAIKKH